MKPLPIGLSDYKQLIDKGFYYVDKTLLVEEVISHGGSAVTLIPRPRRFGKTVNMSMLRYFFEKSEVSHRYLFEDKKIWDVAEAREWQGSFPLIYLTFKDVRSSNWAGAYNILIQLIANEYIRHQYLCIGDALNRHEKALFERICSLHAAEGEYKLSLLYLSQFLERYHQKKTIILIDEYDLPIHEAIPDHYYNEVIQFMRGFLSAGLKDNSALEFSVITGILRTAKEGIFSGLNNLEVYTLLSEPFADKFGFTDLEINQLLAEYCLEGIKNEFKAWYNGYLIGKTKIYNPWSTVCCVKAKGLFLPYWGNTSGNALISKMIATAPTQVNHALTELLKGHTLEKMHLDEQSVLSNLASDPQALWSLLLFSGYLTAEAFTVEMGRWYGNLLLPNLELKILFQNLIDQLFRQSLGDAEFLSLKAALQNGNGELFSAVLAKFIAQSMSWHDISDEEPEKSYHLFVLGLLVVLADSYSVRSNRESGYGRYDIVLIPHDRSQAGFVIEFKKKDAKESMEECANRALEQIQQKKYASELQSLGVHKVILFGLAFHKKNILLVQGI